MEGRLYCILHSHKLEGQMMKRLVSRHEEFGGLSF
jgi:hypothetical protein